MGKQSASKRRLITSVVAIGWASAWLVWSSSGPARVLAGPEEIAWPAIKLQQVVTGLNQPTSITHAGDGSGRLFVTERQGRTRIVLGDTLLPLPFLDISDRVATVREQGLNSIAFPPGYLTKGYLYVNYAKRSTHHTAVSRFHLGTDPNAADASSEQLVLDIRHPANGQHWAGQLAFRGSDGFLYISTGDGGVPGDPYNNAQIRRRLLGKILRIDTETGDPVTYIIPADNPFIHNTNARKEIWAVGLRNPWRFSFDSATHDLYIADVGFNREEEIDFEPAANSGGRNYGWHILEGRLCLTPLTGCVPPRRYSAPVATFLHGPHRSNGCAVVGGYVYRGTKFPALTGFYLFGDLCTGKIWGLIKNNGVWRHKLLYDAPFLISTFGVDETGELYVADFGNGTIYRIEN